MKTYNLTPAQILGRLDALEGSIHIYDIVEAVTGYRTPDMIPLALTRLAELHMGHPFPTPAKRTSLI